MPNPPWYVPAKEAAPVYTAERCYITELLNDERCPGQSLALASVEPGVTTQLHALRDITECYVICSGRGVVEIDGVQHKVNQGDQIIIDAGLPQRITNTGASKLDFYCICTPRFQPFCYVDLESESQCSGSTEN